MGEVTYDHLVRAFRKLLSAPRRVSTFTSGSEEEEEEERVAFVLCDAGLLSFSSSSARRTELRGLHL